MIYKAFAKLYFLIILTSISNVSNANTNLTDDAIANQLIQESIASYSGRCPYPYNAMKNGKACGGRSAYSKPGGESPLCYRKDITADMIKQWRNQNNKK